MEQYIDKSIVIAEIERRLGELSQLKKASYEIGLYDAYKIVLSFLNTLEVKEIWKSANGEDLPEYDREVVVFTQNFPDDAGILRVAIAHRPNPNGFDGKNVTTGKVEHYTPKTYDKGGWSIPDVVWWLDCDLPKKEI